MNLTVHNVYFCFSEVGCTIALRDGTPCKEVPAHTPTLFVAQQPDMVCSDPAAVVRELPNGLQLLHGQMMKEQADRQQPAWKLKYAECVTPMDMYAVSPETTKIEPNNFGAIYLTTDFCSDGTWAYPLPKLETVNCGGWNVNVFRSYKLPEFVIELPNLKQWCGGISVDETWKTKRTIVYAPKVERVYSVWEAHSTYFYITADNVKIFSDNTFSKNHTQFDFELPKLENGAGGFNNSAMNKESALRILNSIPAYTSGSHKLTIGIHVDHQTDDDVLAAIANAEAKGWTLTVQWNGTPTAQASVTYGLRKPPIYARVEEHDGERYLDWGHYVTDETGYEVFRSVEVAREYFGLSDESLTETE